MKSTEVIRIERCFIERDGNNIVVWLYDFADNEAGGRILAKTLYPDALYIIYKWAKEIFQNINKHTDCYNCLKWETCKELKGADSRFRDECRKAGYKYWYPKYEL
jgi:hypothetical protein